MNNHLHLVEPTPNQRSPSHEGRRELGGSVTGDEQDIEEMLSNPVNDLVREMSRLISRQGPLSPDVAVQAMRRVAEAVTDDARARRYPVTSTHVLWLGSVLYYALTGKAPLAPRPGVGSPSSPPLVSSSSPYPISQGIERIIATCLSPDPRDRWSSVNELDRALGALPEAGNASVSQLDAEVRSEGDDDTDLESETPTIPPVSGVCLTRAASAPVSEGAPSGARRDQIVA